MSPLIKDWIASSFRLKAPKDAFPVTYCDRRIDRRRDLLQSL